MSLPPKSITRLDNFISFVSGNQSTRNASITHITRWICLDTFDDDDKDCDDDEDTSHLKFC